MTPVEAVGTGALSGAGVLGIGMLILRHLVSKWLQSIDNLPGQLDEVRDELMGEIDKVRRELTGNREHGDTSIAAVRQYAETELNAQRASGHNLREKVGLDVGVLMNRVSVAEKRIDEMGDEITKFREDLHRVDSNVILIAAKLEIKPVMPGQRQ